MSVEDGKILAVSLYSLDCIPYNEEFTEVTWEDCSLRKWLNEDFYNAAFSISEKNLIPVVTLENDDHPMLHTDGGNDTEDKVFCLSLEETEKYFGEYDKAERDRIEEQIAMFSKLKVALAPHFGRGASPEIIKASIDDAKANFLPEIDKLIGKVDW